MIDLGCGYGGAALHIAKKLGCKAVGINISPYQVQQANQLARVRNFSEEQVYFQVADGMCPPHPDGEFDLVYSVESSIYMPDLRVFLQQMVRLTAPKGQIVLLDFCRKPGELTKLQKRHLSDLDAVYNTAGDMRPPHEYVEILRAAGMTDIKVADWTPHIRGFWTLSLWELFSRPHSGSGKPPTLLQMLRKVGGVGMLCALLMSMLHAYEQQASLLMPDLLHPTKVCAASIHVLGAGADCRVLVVHSWHPQPQDGHQEEGGTKAH
eukprot:jgi/Chrzof1/8636/Cz03g18130.t1